MYAQGYLKKGKDSDRTGRGAEPFVPVDWDSALDLVANELARVREAHGNTSIFAGSYGWASAGRLHHARTLLHRFLNGFGGFTGQVTNYSYAAGMIVMPHVVGTHRVVSGPLTDWRSITENTKLMVMFGGVPVKNARSNPAARASIPPSPGCAARARPASSSSRSARCAATRRTISRPNGWPRRPAATPPS